MRTAKIFTVLALFAAALLPAFAGDDTSDVPQLPFDRFDYEQSSFNRAMAPIEADRAEEGPPVWWCVTGQDLQGAPGYCVCKNESGCRELKETENCEGEVKDGKCTKRDYALEPLDRL